MKISGSGTISGGDYDNEILISGSGIIDGDMRCAALHASGSVGAEGNVECTGEVHISGSGRFRNLKAKGIHVSGTIHADELLVSELLNVSGTCRTDGAVTAENARVSGSIYVKGGAKFGTAKISGRFDCDGDVEAEDFSISGPLSVKGLLNAENVGIRLGFKKFTNVINSIGGTDIKIEIREEAHGLFARKAAVTVVNEAIEGDSIYLENTECPLVVGKTVMIGEGCRIGKVQYYDTFEIKDGAEVKEKEKI